MLAPMLASASEVPSVDGLSFAPRHAVVAHPLLSAEGQALIESLRQQGMSDDEIARNVSTRVGVEDLGDGPVYRIGAVVAESLVEPSEPAPGAWVVDEAPMIDDEVVELASSRASDDVTVWARFIPPRAADAASPHDLTSWWNLAAIEGRIATIDDLHDERRAFVDDQLERHASDRLRYEEALAAIDARVLRTTGFGTMFQVSLPPARLDSLFALPELRHVHAEEDTGEGDSYACASPAQAGYCFDVHGPQLDGVELEDLLQTAQFHLSGHRGEPSQVMIFEDVDYAHFEHFGFDDDQGVDRLTNCENIDSVLCHPVDLFEWNPLSYGHHSTASISLGIGDLTRGQEAAVGQAFSTLEQRRYSGSARDMRGQMVKDLRLFNMPTRAAAYDAYLVSSSKTYTNYGPCDGEQGSAVAADALYVSGALVMKSAGNEGHPSNDCTTGAMANAHSVFSVGAYKVDDTPTGHSEFVAHDAQSRGGVSLADGRERTTVDVQGPSSFISVYREWQWPTSGGNDQYFGFGGGGTVVYTKTSSSTPAVAGGAALLQHHLSDTYGPGFALNPGHMAVNLLLGGDRRDEAVGGLVLNKVGYSNLTGAGKMHLRRFDEWGLDAPFAWDSGNLCVEHGQEIALSIASANPLSADADGLEVVTWFFDHDYSSHPPDNQLVEVDMWVEEWDGATWSVAEQDLGTSDNKRRVWLDTQANHAYRLHIKGTRVPRNAPGCDSDHIRVFWGYYLEDDAHDSGSALMPFIRPD